MIYYKIRRGIMKNWWKVSDEEFDRIYHSPRRHAITPEDEAALVGAVVEGINYTHDDDDTCGFSLYVRTMAGMKVEINIEGPASYWEDYRSHVDIYVVDWD